MQLSYIEFDDRLDAILTAEQCAPQRQRNQFSQRFMLGWLYHELSLEGVVLDEHDLSRALAGREGRDYCDGVLLDTVRHTRMAFQRLRDASVRRERLTKGLLDELHAMLHGGPVKHAYRTDSGATEQYKHDVIAPDRIEDELQGLLFDLDGRDWMNHPIERAIRAHYRMTRIWPYNQRSGLMARLVQHHVLLSNGYPPALIHACDRQKYYHALHYDVRRLHNVVVSAMRGQVELRERIFGDYARAPRRRIAAGV